MNVVRDRALIERLWSEAWRAWFPRGMENPGITLLRFDAERGEFWDHAGMRRAQYAFEAAKAYLTHATPPIDSGQHGRVRL